MERDDELMLSGLQHFAYCRRQWALIHVEQLWAENYRTADGHVFHERTHDESQTERRGDLLITRGMRVRSQALGVGGQCDVVEFHLSPKGVPLHGQEGLWLPYPVEYKRGAPKEHDADELQLCCQAMCLEEMLCCEIPSGSLFYGETRRRVTVAFTPELRERVSAMLREMHDYFARGYTPKCKAHRGCAACSLRELCLPGMGKLPTIHDYLDSHMAEEAQ